MMNATTMVENENRAGALNTHAVDVPNLLPSSSPTVAEIAEAFKPLPTDRCFVCDREFPMSFKADAHLCLDCEQDLQDEAEYFADRADTLALLRPW